MKEKNIVRNIPIISIRQVKEKSVAYDDVMLTSPEAVFRLAKDLIGGYDREVMLVITLNTRKKPNSINILSIGTVNASLVHPREVFKPAILSNGASIIMVHNHPSGAVSPSAEDKALTERIKAAGDIMGIELTDHVIVTDMSYFSFRESGTLS